MNDEELNLADEELIRVLDYSIFLERDRDQCARERDAYKAERDQARDALWDVVNAARAVDVRGVMHDLPGALAAAEALLAGDASRVNARAEYWGRVEAERDAARAEAARLLAMIHAYNRAPYGTDEEAFATLALEALGTGEAPL